jgi:hypothetical protein
MHTLSDLNHLLTENNIPVDEFIGWRLVCGDDTWSMLDDQYYKNNVLVSRKEILKYVKEFRVVEVTPRKKITPNKGIEHDSESVEVDHE